MKRCSQCRRDYYDDTLSFCLEDGAELVYGVTDGEPATAILHDTEPANEAPTRAQIHTTASAAEPPTYSGRSSEKQSFSANRAAKPVAAIVLTILALGGFFAYQNLKPAVAEQISS